MNEKEIPTSDPLADSLRREAMAERPAFSPELHERLVQSVHRGRIAGDEPRSLRIGQWYAVAAGLLIASALTMYAMQSHDGASPRQPAPIVENVLEPSPGATASNVDLARIVSAKFWPPTITVQLPSSEAGISLVSQPRQAPSAQPQASEPAGLPDMLFAMLQEPTNGINGALTDVLPPGMRDFLDWKR